MMTIDLSIPGNASTLGYVDALFFAFQFLLCVFICVFGYWNDKRKTGG